MQTGDHLAETILRIGLVADPWVDGRLRFDATPLTLSRARLGALANAAVGVARVVDGVMERVAKDGHAPTELGLHPVMEALALLDAPRWLAVARVDVFELAGQGVLACEVNADTPTGIAEMRTAAALLQDPSEDPSALFESRWKQLMSDAAGGDLHGAVVGFLEPTDMPDDLNHARLVHRWLTDLGASVVHGAPMNLTPCEGNRVALFGRPCDVLIRHYKTDWWGPRASVWLDEEPPPWPEPLAREIVILAEAMAAGTVNVINPFGTAIAQNKRVLALPFECPSYVGDELALVARHVLPETRFAESLPLEQLQDEQRSWVLKSDYGCEGEEVIVGPAVSADLWEATLKAMRPGRWVAQRAFEPARDAHGHETNFGIWMLGGAPSGVLVRRSALPTDGTACTLPFRVTS